MTNHGFGVITLKSSKSNMSANQRIAKCISKIPGIAYAHSIHQSFTYDSRVDEKMKWIPDKVMEPHYDLIFEMERKLEQEEINKIKECASKDGHRVYIKFITVQHPNWRRGAEVTHPPKPE